MTPSRILQVTGVVRRLLQAVAVAALLAMMLHTIANALLRYLAASPITGTTEYVGYWYLPVVALLGFYFAQRGRAHIEARLLFDRLPHASRVEVQLGAQALTVALCAGFAYYGWAEAVEAAGIGLTAGVTGIAVWPVTFVVPVAFALLGLQLALDAVAVRRQQDPDAGAAGHQPHVDSTSVGD